MIPLGVYQIQMASTIDLFPTIANLVSAELPKHLIDGIDITSILKGDKESSPRDHFVFLLWG